jgi:amino acid adenylation domain-containing protein
MHAHGAITYRQLMAAASGTGAALSAGHGVRPGTVVPVLLRRGPELVEALLGITSLGVGYAALDWRWPDRRVRQICSMLGAPVAVTDESRRVGQAIWSPVGLPPSREGAGGPLPNDHFLSPDAVCSVFFTSGSTGEPKAIPVSYRALAGLLRPGGMPMRLGPSTVMSVAAPTPWDAFALELWGPLLNGGTCVLTEGDYLSPAELRENVARRGQNTLWLTGSLFNLFVEEDLGAFAGITQVATGGERLSPDHVREFLLAHPGARLFNGYGPAENCIFSTMHAVTLGDCDLPGGIPIGKPVRGTEAYVLDGERACRPGELGEICLAGARLSAGYLGDPELTRRVFAAVELSGRQTRIYRTGDLGWQDEEGVFHFYGRADRQVKVRGHRIEPAEIERHVAAHPAIAQCAVVPVTEDGSTVTELTACYQARSMVSTGELRTFLCDRLPAYLVPEHWLPVERIPLLDNGKADLRALRARANRVLAVRSPGVHVAGAAADPLLAGLNDLVVETTGLGPLSPDASLLAAGANSLQLMRLCVRASRRWRVRVEPAGFFRKPTVAHLADLVSQASPQPADRDGARGSTRPLNPAQSAFLVAEAVDPANRRAWHCTLAWRMEGAVDEQALRNAVDCVHRRHPALHARYPIAPPFQSAQTDPPTTPEFTVRSCPAEDAARASLDEALHAPFRLDRGPAWRSLLARVDGQEVAMFGIAVHHVAFDDWSERILARDLSAAYAAHLSGAPGRGRWFTGPLPWPVVAPADAAAIGKQRLMLADKLAGTPALTFPAPPGQATIGNRAGVIVRVLDAGKARRCRALARAHATTPFVIGLAGYAAAASRLTGMTDFPVAVPVAQRGPENEDAIGCLLNLLCIRLRLPDTSGEPLAAIAAAKRAARHALLTQDVPFPEAIALLRPAVMPNLFVLQQDASPALELPGCRASLRRPTQRYTGFECQLELRLPSQDTGEIVLTYRTAAVDDAFASSLAGAFAAFIAAAPIRARPSRGEL